MKKLLKKPNYFVLGFLFAFVFLSPSEPFSIASAEKRPLMKSALLDLKAAERKLENAYDDEGGHRLAALKSIREAIAHIKQGINFDN